MSPAEELREAFRQEADELARAVARAIHDGPTAQEQYRLHDIAPHAAEACPWFEQYLGDARVAIAAVFEVVGCPTCSGPVRETVNLVCQTCGKDYARRLDDGRPPVSPAEEYRLALQQEAEELNRPAPVVPDSRGLRERVRGVLTDAARRESFSGTDIDALTDAVLAVVGQGVTAGCDDREPHTDCEPHLTVWADGATAEQREAIYEAAMGAAFTAAEGMDGVDVGGVGTLSDNRAAVRPTGQEG